MWTIKLEAAGPRHELLPFILTLAFLATKGLVQSFFKGVVALRPLVYPTFSRVTFDDGFDLEKSSLLYSTKEYATTLVMARS